MIRLSCWGCAFKDTGYLLCKKIPSGRSAMSLLYNALTFIFASWSSWIGSCVHMTLLTCRYTARACAIVFILAMVSNVISTFSLLSLALTTARMISSAQTGVRRTTGPLARRWARAENTSMHTCRLSMPSTVLMRLNVPRSLLRPCLQSINCPCGACFAEKLPLLDIHNLGVRAL
jgi:hypothetical protein